jgi:hypothetical protein
LQPLVLGHELLTHTTFFGGVELIQLSPWTLLDSVAQTVAEFELFEFVTGPCSRESNPSAADPCPAPSSSRESKQQQAEQLLVLQNCWSFTLSPVQQQQRAISTRPAAEKHKSHQFNSYNGSNSDSKQFLADLLQKSTATASQKKGTDLLLQKNADLAQELDFANA